MVKNPRLLALATAHRTSLTSDSASQRDRSWDETARVLPILHLARGCTTSLGTPWCPIDYRVQAQRGLRGRDRTPRCSDIVRCPHTYHNRWRGAIVSFKVCFMGVSLLPRSLFSGTWQPWLLCSNSDDDFSFGVSFFKVPQRFRNLT